MNSIAIFSSVKILYFVKNFLLEYCVIYQNFWKNKENMNIFVLVDNLETMKPGSNMAPKPPLPN